MLQQICILRVKKLWTAKQQITKADFLLLTSSNKDWQNIIQLLIFRCGQNKHSVQRKTRGLLLQLECGPNVPLVRMKINSHRQNDRTDFQRCKGQQGYFVGIWLTILHTLFTTTLELRGFHTSSLPFS